MQREGNIQLYSKSSSKTADRDSSPDRQGGQSLNPSQIREGSSKGTYGSLDILLGDIIEFDSPENPEYHQQSFIVTYIKTTRYLTH